MNFQDTLAWLYDQLPMYQRIGKSAFKKDLTNTLRLCEALDNPQEKFRSVHIAGTNGKGSSAHMLASILQSAGYKTGLYTSPHLKSFTERIRIDGQEVSEDFVCEFVERIKPDIEEIKPSFFEITVVMAFEYFAQSNVDIAVIEVGLGGRFDSTNVITPIVSLITSIGLDHTDMLGDTLPQIAFEKAGIIKEKVPVVISETQSETTEVFEKKALDMRSPIYFADKIYSVEGKAKESAMMEFTVGHDHGSDSYLSDLGGEYQAKNLPGVLQVIDLLNEGDFVIGKKSINSGLRDVVGNTGLKGRWQKLNNDPLVVCDTVHNEAGIVYLIRQFSSITFEKLFIIWGAVEGKDLHGIFGQLPKDAFYYFCEASVPRAFSAEKMHKIASELDREGHVVRDVNEAISDALEKAGSNDLIFVGGSNFIVAEIHNL